MATFPPGLTVAYFNVVESEESTVDTFDVSEISSLIGGWVDLRTPAGESAISFTSCDVRDSRRLDARDCTSMVAGPWKRRKSCIFVSSSRTSA